MSQTIEAVLHSAAGDAKDTVHFTQDDRLIAIETPLGKDYLLLLALQGDEPLSQPFSYHAEMLSADPAIAPESLIGRAVKILMRDHDGNQWPLHGMISQFHAGSLSIHNHRHYSAEIVPWLWFLRHSSDCRIFQHLSIPDIIEQVFQTLGFRDYESSVAKSDYPKLDFCVQYRETAFNFVSRLMEHAGIFYYFRHENDRHVLIMTDSNVNFRYLENPDLSYSTTNAPRLGHVTSWRHSYRFRPGRWAQTDYDFEMPTKNLQTTEKTVLKLRRAEVFERFDYPGCYVDRGPGTQATRTLMEAEEAAYHLVEGASHYMALRTGSKFKLQGHPCHEDGVTYVVSRVRHDAADLTSFGNASDVPHYANSFEAIPHDVRFRPLRTTAKPVVHGPQTATVVGPPGEKIYTDKYGRVRVQFHWDRYGKRDHKSSCWIRVSQYWAGRSWGGFHLPHVGHEVVVSFLEGDPDQPLVTGRVYNGDNGIAMEMPANKTQSANRDHAGNEILMEGKGGFEDIRINAVKDMNVTVKNDYNETVKTGNRKVGITEGTYTHTVAAKTAERTSKGENLIQSTTANVQVEAATTIQLHVGASTFTMDKEGKVEIKANDIILDAKTISLSGQTSVETVGGRVNATAQETHTIKGALVKIN